MLQPGQYRYQAIMPRRMKKPIMRSTKATITVAVGTIRRGKYTLLMRLEFPMRLFPDSENAVEKNCHGNSPANTISAYGASPSVGSLANRPKTRVNTTIVRKGRITVHASPTIVCL